MKAETSRALGAVRTDRGMTLQQVADAFASAEEKGISEEDLPYFFLMFPLQ